MSIHSLTHAQFLQDSVYHCRKNWTPEDKQFYNKDGFLTLYGYGCGYQTTFTFCDYTLSLDLDGIWHVRLHHGYEGRVFWESFDDTTKHSDAKKFFLRIRRMLKEGASMAAIKKEAGYAERLYKSRHGGGEPATLELMSGGIPFTVRLVRNGDTYGRHNALTHDKDSPLVEFYDARHKQTELGQFIARYYAHSLLTRDTASGLIMQGDVPDWQIDAAGMGKVVDWLRTLHK